MRNCAIKKMNKDMKMARPDVAPVEVQSISRNYKTCDRGGSEDGLRGGGAGMFLSDVL